MNREIKFRAFDKEKKVMFEIFDNTTQKDWYLPSWKENFEVMQFIGLKDKNGKDIYEGDIDKSDLYVAYNQLHCCFGLFGKYGYIRDIQSDCYDKKGKTLKHWQSFEIEIIGNIYENPELLTK
jgi:uncharacterized phage protein (TIGR01671 family)